MFSYACESSLQISPRACPGGIAGSQFAEMIHRPGMQKAHPSPPPVRGCVGSKREEAGMGSRRGRPVNHIGIKISKPGDSVGEGTNKL